MHRQGRQELRRRQYLHRGFVRAQDRRMRARGDQRGRGLRRRQRLHLQGDLFRGRLRARRAKDCDDGQVCTKGDACLAGVCKSGTDVCKCSEDADCLAGDDGNLCNGLPFCNLASGQCGILPTKHAMATPRP